ncbi:Hypothetical protein SRAE_2000413700 [Strongyloides ratti]|uniref:Uncharacterized protein n=1 Tax=Strongyloides ratti TaxID=34506 RepID=A0A090LMU4_STRRB|nr:Hypothetical protein SRAE_2000413700 [Strongyloides ratti]CEF69488.1 Hypothetical protein SRAE_2000413700 [Strongyloides ratti]
MKNDNIFFWCFLGISSIVFVIIFAISFYYHNNRKKKRVGSIEGNFYQNANISQNVIRKQRSLDQKNDSVNEICTISGKQKIMQQNVMKNQMKNDISPNNFIHPSITRNMPKNTVQLEKMARSFCILTNAIKNDKQPKNNIFVKIDEAASSFDKVNSLKTSNKNDEKKTISEIESDNLLKDNVLFKDIQAEVEEHRKEAKRRGVDEDSYIFQSMNKNQKTQLNDLIKDDKYYIENENKNKDTSTTTTTDTAFLKQARQLLECDILHKDIQTEKGKRREEACRRGLDKKSNTPVIS